MAVEQDKSGQAGEPTGARIAVLVRDAQRALAEAEQLLTEAQEAGDPLRAAHLAARQAAIVDAAHEEAAVILAKAHADAAQILELAVTGRRVGPSGASPAGSERQAVVDLRDDDPATPSRPTIAPALPDAPDPLDQDVRASIAAAADMARRVSGRIERLSQDLHQAPAP